VPERVVDAQPPFAAAPSAAWRMYRDDLKQHRSGPPRSPPARRPQAADRTTALAPGPALPEFLDPKPPGPKHFYCLRGLCNDIPAPERLTAMPVPVVSCPP